MKGLKCTTANCEFNQACRCNAGIVNVGKTAVCNSKLKRTMGVLEQEFANMEAAEDFDYAHNTEVLIECECAECMYNDRTKCTAELVNIADGFMRTKCVTRKDRS